MISAQEAIEKAERGTKVNQEKALKNALDEINIAINERADEGHRFCTFKFSDKFEEYTIEQISRILKNNGFHVDEIVESDELRKLFGRNLFDTNFDPFINLNCCNVKRITGLKITW